MGVANPEGAYPREAVVGVAKPERVVSRRTELGDVRRWAGPK